MKIIKLKNVLRKKIIKQIRLIDQINKKILVALPVEERNNFVLTAKSERNGLLFPALRIASQDALKVVEGELRICFIHLNLLYNSNFRIEK